MGNNFSVGLPFLPFLSIALHARDDFITEIILLLSKNNNHCCEGICTTLSSHPSLRFPRGQENSTNQMTEFCTIPGGYSHVAPRTIPTRNFQDLEDILQQSVCPAGWVVGAVPPVSYSYNWPPTVYVEVPAGVMQKQGFKLNLILHTSSGHW